MKEEILNIIYKYYPKNLYYEMEGFDNTVEYMRLRASIKIAEENIRKWNVFMDKLQKLLVQKYKVEDWTQLFNNDACYTCRILYSSFNNIFIVISINVSIISNFFSIYCSTTKKENGSYSIPDINFDLNNIDSEILILIRKTIYSFFPDYEEFPVPLVNEIVPEVSVGNKIIGEATFFECIFTTHIW